jgi:hypothetical protein
MSAVDFEETLRELVDAKINKNKYGSSRKEREIADSIIILTATEADRLMARNVALQEEDNEA